MPFFKRKGAGHSRLLNSREIVGDSPKKVLFDIKPIKPKKQIPLKNFVSAMAKKLFQLWRGVGAFGNKFRTKKL